MKAKEWLKIYCLEKMEALNSLKSGLPPYVTAEDLKEIDSWPEDECKNIIRRMKIEHEHDGSICPWCQKNQVPMTDDPDCDSCGYGKRHGKCDDAFSDYDRLWHSIGGRICTKIRVTGLPIWSLDVEE